MADQTDFTPELTLTPNLDTPAAAAAAPQAPAAPPRPGDPPASPPAGPARARPGG